MTQFGLKFPFNKVIIAYLVNNKFVKIWLWVIMENCYEIYFSLKYSKYFNAWYLECHLQLDKDIKYSGLKKA